MPSLRTARRGCHGSRTIGNKTLTQLREELLAKPGMREAYEEQAPEFAIRTGDHRSPDRRRAWTGRDHDLRALIKKVPRVLGRVRGPR